MHTVALLLAALLMMAGANCKFKWKKAKPQIRTVYKKQDWGDGGGAKVFCDKTFAFRWDREFQKAFDCNWTFKNPVCGYNYSDRKIQEYSNQCTACISSLKVKYFVKGKCP